MSDGQDSEKFRRWTDHWQVKLMIAVLGFVGLTTASGGTWVVSRAVSNESKNVEQDYRIKSIEERWGEVREEQRIQRAILEDIRREVKK